jgi:hypothetical protein
MDLDNTSICFSSMRSKAGRGSLLTQGVHLLEVALVNTATLHQLRPSAQQSLHLAQLQSVKADQPGLVLIQSPDCLGAQCAIATEAIQCPSPCINIPAPVKRYHDEALSAKPSLVLRESSPSASSRTRCSIAFASSACQQRRPPSCCAMPWAAWRSLARSCRTPSTSAPSPEVVTWQRCWILSPWGTGHGSPHQCG